MFNPTTAELRSANSRGRLSPRILAGPTQHFRVVLIEFITHFTDFLLSGVLRKTREEADQDFGFSDASYPARERILSYQPILAITSRALS